jgi:hypothetical protein
MNVGDMVTIRDGAKDLSGFTWQRTSGVRVTDIVAPAPTGHFRLIGGPPDKTIVRVWYRPDAASEIAACFVADEIE